MGGVLRAVFGYYFLVLTVRIAGRRPGKQLTPLEFVIVFFVGGITLTYMVGDDRSLINALCQITAIALAYSLLIAVRQRWPTLGKAIDGTPLTLLAGGKWMTNTLVSMGITDDDVMASARDKGILDLQHIDYAVLERNGEISVIKKED